MIQLAILNMENTTVDCTFAVHDAIVSSFEGVGLEIDRKTANDCIPVPNLVGIRKVLKEKFDSEDEAQANQINTYLNKFINHYYKKSTQLRPMPGAEGLFLTLREKGIKIYLTSGFERKTVDILMKRFKWIKNNLIDGTIAADEIQQGRPFPDMIQKAMHSENIMDARVVLKVGDHPLDVLEGKNAGCGLNLVFYSGSLSPNELKEGNPDGIIHTLSEIPQYIDKLEQIQ
ncbi:HAD hydrolase-like protein [Luteibaculum oceani]|uniref:HAD family hydrolase n=1 Tax=Luteibaculum oceani TaxID=1294296 RepID=A0A5C6V2T1_9FLAO|nr:HAD hydrolase-like protein [Luteibaculum oceani]TXC78786.1 HAD family hydrolase [Luteibaculum oceani]